eukprot:s2713_g12.t1
MTKERDAEECLLGRCGLRFGMAAFVGRCQANGHRRHRYQSVRLRSSIYPEASVLIHFLIARIAPKKFHDVFRVPVFHWFRSFSDWTLLGDQVFHPRCDIMAVCMFVWTRP